MRVVVLLVPFLTDKLSLVIDAEAIYF